MAERANGPGDAVAVASTTERRPTSTGRPPQAGDGWVQSTIDEGTWSDPDRELYWNGEQQQYNWTDRDGVQQSTPSRPPDEQVKPRRKPDSTTEKATRGGAKTQAAATPPNLDGWKQMPADKSAFKHPSRDLWWDSKERQYTWDGTDGHYHQGGDRPPDDQIKKSGGGDFDDD